ncbi:hypothetical protein Slala04_43330 [Streptomyces lavendulae subsp. lavendulae]|nr:hypothetical protein Slala04_43330 [Streptomyces lavendulae subsp. lavendulae]
MPSPTAEELRASVKGLPAQQVQQIADHIDACRRLLASGTSMDAVQQHLKDEGLSVIHSILVTSRLLGDHPSRLRAAIEIVSCSPARTTTDPPVSPPQTG